MADGHLLDSVTGRQRAMSQERTFDRLVRARMELTGETPAEARSALLEPGGTGPPVPFPISEEAVQRRTGRGWEQWLDLLDEWGSSERSHAAIANWLIEQHGVDPWSAQAVAVGYERAHGRAVGERFEGFEISASKTVAVPVDRLFDAFVDASVRERWLRDVELRERTSKRPKTARFDWGDGLTRIHATFSARGASRSAVSLQHVRLPSAEEAERMKAFWAERLVALKALLEG